MKRIFKHFPFYLITAVLTLFLTVNFSAQTTTTSTDDQSQKPTIGTFVPKVIQINEVTIKKLLKPNGKPLLINFWATWCIPCREEFPDLVEIDNEYKDKIDFITITLDDPAEIDRDVAKFLTSMKATMPTFLLYTPNESEVIGSIAKEWQGGLPFTVLYDKSGDLVHFKQGKIKPETIRKDIDSLLESGALVTVTEFVKITNERREEAIYYYENNWKAFRKAAKEKGMIDSFDLIISKSDEKLDFDIILITRFKDNSSFKKAEENFRQIIKELRPDGRKLLNEIKPSDFRENVSVKTGESHQ